MHIKYYSKENGDLPGMVAHTCNPNTWEAEIGGSQV
jgi:hypothetical protein